MGEKVRVGVVGAGQMGQCAHLRSYASLDECEVVALAELRPELARRVAAKYEVPAVYADHREMLESAEVDAIVASQQFQRHGSLLPELLATGLPVFCEKPLAGTIEAGEKIAAAESGGWLMVGYHKRSDPATMYAKARIEHLKDSGELGAMTYVRILMPAGDWIAGGFFDLIRTNEPPPQGDLDPPAADMDAETFEEYTKFVNYYIHQINLLAHLFGEPYEVTHADPGGILMVARSRSGVCGAIEMSPYRTSVGWQESALVCFERGYVKLELPAPLAINRPGRVEVLSAPGAEPQTTVPHLPPVHAMRQQAKNFIAAVRGERTPMTTAAEALEDLRVARQYIRLLRDK